MSGQAPSTAARLLAQAQRSADARKAWDEYQSERDQMARKTEKLKAQRLAAEAAVQASEAEPEPPKKPRKRP